MKKKNILFATCLLGAFAFSSCEKNLYDESKQSEKEIKMTDLNIPEDFQWNLTQVTKGTTIANTQTKVSLFLDEKCSKDEKVATIPVYNKAINLPLSLPTYVKTIYAQYQSKSGKMITKSVAVNANGSYTLNIPDAIEAIPTRAITRDNNKKDDDYNIEDDIKYDKERGVVYHPKKGWGTIMFEDQFPSLGDYDFNDFVANYQVLFEVSKAKEKDEYESKYIAIALCLKAVGGVFPYNPYLRLKKIKNKNIESVMMSHYKTGEEIEVNLIDNKNPKGNLIIDCTPLVQNLDRRGSKYFNTERNALVTKEEDLPEIIIEIKLKEPKEIDDILEDDEFDLYLKRNDNGTEIHMNGIEPIAYQYPFNDKNLYPIYEDGEEEDDNYYYSNERLIWGLRVPGNVAHTIEKGDFLKAYKGFAKWAQSGGKNEQNWYNQGNADDNLLIHY